MPMTPQEYEKLNQKESPNSKSAKNITMAFLIGGVICLLGEFLLNSYAMLGFDETQAGAMTSITLVFLSALLTGLNLYDKIAKVGGAGTLVPITGFANAVVSPALEFKAEGYVLGLGAKMFIIAGPVIVYGTLASVAYGVILYLFGLL
ncbi:MAG: stage V sporulation protein AC [Oscillospiraceae bacterium]